MIEFSANQEEPGYFIRLALSLSIITKKPIKIKEIRKGSELEGLTKSDIIYTKILAQLSNAKIKNVDKRSTEIWFEPNDLKKNGQLINLNFPALTPLFLPYLMLIFYNTSHKIRINGPTNREKKITVDYIKEVIVPLLEKINIKQRIEIIKRGYYQDIGSVILYTKDTKEVLPLILTETGDLDTIYAIAHSYGYGEHINQYMIESAKKRMKQEELKIDRVENIFIENREKYKGYGIDIFAKYDNTILGGNYTSIRKQASQVGKEAADRIISAIKKELPLDKHAANIIIPFLALAKKESKIVIPKKDTFVEIATELCNKFLGTEFEYKEEDNKVILIVKPNQ